MAAAASPGPGGPSTGERVVDAAVEAFGLQGFGATSLDDLARTLGVRKQTILYWFPSKEAVLAAALDAAAAELVGELAASFEGAEAAGDEGWPRVRLLVRRAFRLAARRPALVGLLREADRLGPPASTRVVEQLAPLVARAVAWLDAEMAAGRLRRHDPEAVVLAAYSMLTGLAADLETQRALGMPTSLRAVVARERAVERLLEAALAP